MTETDATKRPLTIPENYAAYIDKFRLDRLFKDIVTELVLNLPKDHLKHIKIYLNRRLLSYNEPEKIIMLVSPELNIDVKVLVQEIVKTYEIFAITRRFVLDKYEKHDDYMPGCISPQVMSEVTKAITQSRPIPQSGWIMFGIAGSFGDPVGEQASALVVDHPCTVQEAKCLQEDGVLQSMTLVLVPTPPVAPVSYNPYTPARSFFQQDFDGLKFMYKATIKEIEINKEDATKDILDKCLNGIRAMYSGAQGPGQGFHTFGCAKVYRVLLLGPRGCGRRTHAKALAKAFGLVYCDYDNLYKEAKLRDDELSERLKKYGLTANLKAEIVKRRIMKKDCLDKGWVLRGYPSTSFEFDILDSMETPPNRVIFLNAKLSTCKTRLMKRAVDWCTGKDIPRDNGAYTAIRPRDTESVIDEELDIYFSETMVELRAAAGFTAIEVNADEPPMDEVQTKLQAALMISPLQDIEFCNQDLHQESRTSN